MSNWITGSLDNWIGLVVRFCIHLNQGSKAAKQQHSYIYGIAAAKQQRP
tara:strand:- start:275 stop:421 length:147 start_codon:yes stop_codon:yes gene_type:complete